MPRPVDVGSMLGGRYKVTAQVLTSADHDVILDGLDQILNRKVSILVAAPANAERARTSAREIATGERPGTMQILDLGDTEGNGSGDTYLVTSTCPAADLLDLIVAENPPYVEPFFTDNLGSELFGYARPVEPDESRSGRQDFETVRYPDPAAQAEGAESAPPTPHGPPTVPFDEQGVAAAAAAGAAAERGEGAPAEGARQDATHDPSPDAPKVTLWSEDDYGSVDEEHTATATTPVVADKADVDEEPRRAASSFPAAALVSGSGDDKPRSEPAERKRGRWLVGVVIALVLIGGVVFAFNQLGTGFNPVASGPEQQQSGQAGNGEQAPNKADDEPTAEDSQAPKPAAASVTRLVPDSPDLDAGNDGKLPRIIDNNPASYWTSLQYATDQFGGFASNMALVVELKEKTAINRVDLTQLKGSGGSFEILLNDAPTLEGAQKVAEGTFTGPNIALPIPANDGEAPKAGYVIVNFTQLPTLSNTPGPYPYGIQLAEIKIS